jgi:hypothetical protein
MGASGKKLIIKVGLQFGRKFKAKLLRTFEIQKGKRPSEDLEPPGRERGMK